MRGSVKLLLNEYQLVKEVCDDSLSVSCGTPGTTSFPGSLVVECHMICHAIMLHASWIKHCVASLLKHKKKRSQVHASAHNRSISLDLSSPLAGPRRTTGCFCRAPPGQGLRAALARLRAARN